MNVNFNGYGENVATFMADSTVTEAGVPVKVVSNGTVAKCESGDNFCGICVGVREGYAAVQLAGYVTVPTTEEIATGFQTLSASTDGKIAVNTSGRELLVVNSTATDAGIIL